MSVAERPSRGGLIARIQNILLRPGPEWDVIEFEPATVPGLFFGYACLLAAIPLIAMVLQHLIFIHWLLIPTIVIAVLTYFASLLGVFITGVVIDALAPSFDGQKSLVQAMKLSVYSYTALWIAGILNIVPVLGILTFIAGLYGLYILYLGLPKLMKSAPAKTTGYFVVSIAVAIIINFIIGAIIAGISVALTAGAILGSAAAYSAADGHGGANLAALAAASRQLGAAGAAAGDAANSPSASPTAPDGKPLPAIDPAKLKALLPDTLAGMPKTESSSTTLAPGGFAASGVSAVYSQGSERISLTVTDFSALGALAGMAGGMGVESESQTATGYQKVGKVNGRLTTEDWDSTNKSGKYGVLVANRVMVQAEGSGVTMNDLKSAVATVGPDRLEQLARR
jgi:hypothetical protein